MLAACLAEETDILNLFTLQLLIDDYRSRKLPHIIGENSSLVAAALFLLSVSIQESAHRADAIIGNL